ncbi:hypothetical protein ABIC08_009235 [Bradyrhizobium sp. RT9b]
MRQTHIGREKVFADFAGDTTDVVDPITGEAHGMKLFVAAMGGLELNLCRGLPERKRSAAALLNGA